MLKLAKHAVFEKTIFYFLTGLAIVFLITALVFAFLLPDFFGSMSQPITWTDNEFSNLVQANPVYNVTVTASLGFPLYSEQERVSRNSRITHNYAVIQVGSQFVIMDTPSPIQTFQSPQVFRGTLRPLIRPNTQEVFMKALNNIGGNGIEYLARYIYTVNDEFYDGSRPWIVSIFLAPAFIAIGMGLYWALVNAYRLIDHTISPIWKELGRFKVPHDDVFKTIDKDFEMSIQKIGRLRIGNRWIVGINYGTFGAYRLNDIVWVTEEVLRVNTFFKFHTLKIYDRYGQTFSLDSRKKDIDKIISTLNQRIPWAMFGTDSETERLWKRNRTEFIRQIGLRRKTYLQAQQGSQS